MGRHKRLLLPLLATVAIGLPSTIVTSSATAGSCSSGNCSSSSGAAKAAIASVTKKIQRAQSNLASSKKGDLQTAYDAILAIHAEADSKSVATLKVVREPLGELAKAIEKKAADEYLAAKDQYTQGEHAEALARFEALTKFEGLAAARRAASELRKEDDRVAWRELLVESTKLINSHDFEAARTPVSKLHRMARTAGYTEETKEAIASFEGVVAKQIAAAEKDIENGQYDRAYRSLRVISQLSTIRTTALKARGVLKEACQIAEMQQAERDYNEAIRIKREREAAERASAQSKREVAAALK